MLRQILEPERLLAMRRASWRKAEEFALEQSVAAYEQVLLSALKRGSAQACFPVLACFASLPFRRSWEACEA